jgi:16S rRNA processing protein RimM
MKNIKKYLEIAKLTKPQGLKGDLRAQIYCDSPDILDNFETFYLGDDKAPVQAQLKEIRKGFVVLRVDGVHSIEKAEQYAGKMLFIDRDDYELEEDSWFICDLIGLDVIDADSGKLYGKVIEILQNAPKDVYVIKTPDLKTLMFPSIPEVLISVNITERVIKIRPLEGLFDD